METLTIQIPDGYKVKDFDKNSGKVTFELKPIAVTERIKTVEDVLAAYGMTEQQFNDKYEMVPEHLKYQLLAEMLVETLNEGWQPDWNNHNQWKYYPWFEMGGSSSGFRFGVCVGWGSYSYVGSRLCLKNRELATYAGKQFTEVYQKFMLINQLENGSNHQD